MHSTNKSGVTRAVIVLDGREVPVTIRPSDRARRLRLRVLPEIGLEIVVPRGATRDDALVFARRERDWILRQLAMLPRSAPLLTIADGVAIPYLGGPLRIRLIRAGRTRRIGDELVLPVAAGLDVVERWYRAEARRLSGERASAHAATLGVTFGRLAIKDTRSRWGSCSSKGNLNLSWRLVMAPMEVLDYVVAHEVAHLREMNHSPRFWATVETLCPQYREHRRWLRANGPTLAAWPRVTP
ncbi:MAG TPA: SprT family zinc-dependent metalloprotease [Thermomicrobiales bacterium]|nr:SprT family zinc-dependent metalloprotease [Thermomicrobiales bacterium]